MYIHAEDDSNLHSRAAATWRFQPSRSQSGAAGLSYRIADVQDVDAPKQLMLTMSNAQQSPPDNLIRTIGFRRPVFTAKSLHSQRRFRQLNSWRRTSYCGSYWGHGFHEDAVRTAEAAAERIIQFEQHTVATSS